MGKEFSLLNGIFDLTVLIGRAKTATARKFHDQAETCRNDLLSLSFQRGAIRQIGPAGKPRSAAIAPPRRIVNPVEQGENGEGRLLTVLDLDDLSLAAR